MSGGSELLYKHELELVEWKEKKETALSQQGLCEARRIKNKVASWEPPSSLRSHCPSPCPSAFKEVCPAPSCSKPPCLDAKRGLAGLSPPHNTGLELLRTCVPEESEPCCPHASSFGAWPLQCKALILPFPLWKSWSLDLTQSL